MSKGNASTSNMLGEAPQFACDVGLGLKMQYQGDESCTHPSKRAMISPFFSPFNHHPLGGSPFSDGGGLGFLDGGSHFSSSTSTQVFAASLNDTYDAAFHPGAGGVGLRDPFTTSQWHELERQNMIFNYLTAYNSVPADLLLPFSRIPICQTENSGLNCRLSSGSDPEPWRCRRTDGKKWRCTRDVAPDQKYCERHAHKTRPRSRKHVEIQSPKLTNYSHQNSPQILKNQYSNSSRKGSATTYDQTRSIEWLMKGGTRPSAIPHVSTCTQEQRHQQIPSSARMELSDRDNSSFSYKNPSLFQQQEDDQGKQEKIHLTPFMGNDYYPYFDPKVMTSLGRSPTRHFIDAWPSVEISNKKGPFSIPSGSKELPLSSLTLSMSGGDGTVDENEHEAMKSQWMNNISWLNSTGGPLGEALCLANAGTRKGVSDLPSSHGCSNSSNTTSNCSKGSCEEGNHQFNFIG